MAAKRNGNRKQIARGNTEPVEVRKELKVTPAQLVKYLNDTNESAKCSYCGTGDYGVSSDPTGEIASIVATPVPHVKGLGLWLYTAVCTNCGHVVFFHAPTVATKVKGE